MSDNSELKKLAEAATPGPWSMCGEADGSEGFEIIQDIWNERGTHTGKDVVVYEWSDESDPLGVINRKDAEFIAAANPAVVLGLIADLDGYKQGAKVEADAADEARAEVRRLKAECEGLRKAISETSRELRRVSRWICVKVEAGTESATHWAIRLTERADAIDAALSKESAQ